MLSSSIPLEIFSTQFVSTLKAGVGEWLPSYASPEPFFSGVRFTGQRELTTPVQPQEDVVLAMPDGEKHNDAMNAIALHRSLSNLTRLQASDPRIWTRLAHDSFWDYMRARWPAERYSERDKTTRYVLERYFVQRSESRALLRNGIARLWWGAHLSMDKRRENAYELTNVLYSRLDIAQTLLERAIGRTRNILITFLDFIRANDKVLAGDQGRTLIRQLAMYLNLMGGVVILDGLTEKDVRDVLERELERMLNAEPAA